MLRIAEIRYQSGSIETQYELDSFVRKERELKKLGAGEIDEIRLVTRMKITHYGEISSEDGKEMGLTPESDLIEIAIHISRVVAFYPSSKKEDDGFTIVETNGYKYLIRVDFNTMLELSRLLSSSRRQVDFHNKINKEKKNGGIS